MTITAQTSKSGPYNGNGSTTVFSYTFKVADEAHLVVTILASDGITETIKTLNTDYTVTGAGNAGGGSITMLVAPGTGEQLTITRSVALDQEVDLQNRGSVNPETLEASIDKLTQISQDQQQQLDRSLKVDLFETADLDQLTLNVNALASIEGDISTVAGISSDVTAVAADATDIGTVSASIADVNTVAGISSDVTAVAADATDIGTVSTNISDVSTVAGISADVSTVAGISADVTAVAADAADIGTVAADIADVSTVAGISADVTAVAADATDIGTVAADIADVSTVAGISADVTAVAADATDIGTVAGISADVSTVAGISSDISIAATNVADITNYADTYLGPKTADPTLRNDGSALQAGDLYFNTVDDVMNVYDGSAWVAAYVSLSGALIDTNNLSDLTNAATARTNLGLGTAATTASTDYATAAQGSLADSALQAGDNISTLTNDSGYLTDITGQSIKNLSDVYSTMSPTDGQVLTYDTTNGWQAEDVATGTPLFGTVQTLTANKTLTSADDRNLLSCSGGITLTLPALSAGLTFGVLNTDSSNYLVLVGNTASDPIGLQTGSALLDPSSEAILTCDGTRWTLIGGTGKLTVNSVQRSTSGSYTPASGVQAILVCCNGATGGTRAGINTHKGASGGGGYSEKFYSAPFSAPYAYTIGAGGAVASTGGTTTFDTMSIPSSAGTTSSTSSAGGVGSGGDFNATGGTCISGNYGSRGGGGAATRAGNGGDGTREYGGLSGGGGGTGGNNAVYTSGTGGAAATADSASAYSLSAFVTGVTYQAGGNPSSIVGGQGASGYTVYSTSSGSALSIGSPACSRGAPSTAYIASSGYSGSSGHITILEFYV